LQKHKKPWRIGGVHINQGELPSRLQSVSLARRSIGDYIQLYNRKRPHSSLADQTPDEAYFATLPVINSAA
jgi:transposase InsO family protein